MVTKRGVKVIEYNARFGDPEALNVLPLLETDFVKICLSMIDGTLSQEMVQFAPKATVCKYIVPKSYPEAKNEKGQRMVVPKDVPDTVRLFYGDVSLDDAGHILLGGSRSLGIVGIGKTIAEAEHVAEAFAETVEGPIRYRKDIGTAELIGQKVRAVESFRTL